MELYKIKIDTAHQLYSMQDIIRLGIAFGENGLKKEIVYCQFTTEDDERTVVKKLRDLASHIEYKASEVRA